MRRIITLALLLASLIGFEIPHETTIPDGAVGVWECPSIGTTTPLYWTEATGQDIVDREDSAAFRWYGKGRAVLDHADSRCGDGRWNINEIEVGSMAYLITEDATEQYRCTLVCLADVQGWSWVYDGHPIRIHSDEIICACCADDDTQNYIAIFERVGEMQ